MTLLYSAFEPLLLQNEKMNNTMVASARKKWEKEKEKEKVRRWLQKQVKKIEKKIDRGAAAITTTTNDTNTIGSCFCFCSPGEGYGKCFDVYKEENVSTSNEESVNYCAPFENLASDYCPTIGVAQQCSTFIEGQTIAPPTCAGNYDPNTYCSVSDPCPDRKGAAAEPLDTEFCICQPKTWDYCYFIPSSSNCGDSILTKSAPNFKLLKIKKQQ
jgi:hypothetical protein